MQRKGKIANAIMVVAIIIAIVAAVMYAGSLRGWFVNAQEVEQSVLVADKTGIASIERGTVAFSLEENSTLSFGDTIYTTKLSEIKFKYKGSDFTTTNETDFAINKSETEDFKMELISGEVIFDLSENESVEFLVNGHSTTISNVIFTADKQAGSVNIAVLKGEIQIAEQNILSGENLLILEDENIVSALSVNYYSNERLDLLKGYEDIYFTSADINAEISARQAQISHITTADTEENDEGVSTHLESDIDTTNSTNQTDIAGSENTLPTTNSSPSSENNSSEAQTDAPNPQVTSQPEEKIYSCTIEIRCDSILANMGSLEVGKEVYVPANGTILATTTVEFTEGETVMNVLERVTSYTGIQLEYSYTPMYDSNYIEGINHLYEFDCGQGSGWNYKVNGWKPNYGVSKYELSDGDSIKFLYTCDYGNDV